MALRGLVTIGEVAEICGVSRQYISLLHMKGRFLTPMKIGGKNVWDENDVLHWKEENNIGKLKKNMLIDLRHRCFSERTKKILILTAQGRKASEIAEELKIARGYIDTLVWRLRKNFKVKDKEELIKEAIKRNIIKEEDINGNETL